MNAIGRLWWLFLLVLKSRQALLTGSLTAITIAGTILVASGGRGSGIAFFVALGLALAVITMLFVSAQAFRALSGSRPVMLAPNARGKALGALLTFFVGVTFALAVPMTLLAPPALMQSAAVSPVGMTMVLMLIMMVMLTVLAWLLFLPPLFLLLPPLVILPGVLLLRRLHETFPGLQLDPVVIASIALVLGWVLFGRWYLRTRSIRPMLGTRAGQGQAASMDVLGRFLAWLPSRSHERADPAAARRSYWHARATQAPFALLVGGALIAIGFVGVPLTVMQMLSSPRPGHERFFVAAYIAMPLLYVLGLVFLTLLFARRARYLWLRGGSRAALLREAESELWRSDGVLLCAGVTLGVMVLLGVMQGAPIIVLLSLAGAVFAGGMLALSTGLLCAVGVGAGGVAATGVLLFSLLLAGWILAGGTDLVWLVPLAGSQLVGALACRAFAYRRWQRMDWTLRRPGVPWAPGMHS